MQGLEKLTSASSQLENSLHLSTSVTIFGGLNVKDVQQSVTKHYENLLPGVNASLAVFGAMSLKGC
jgi:hypothetical protein